MHSIHSICRCGVPPTLYYDELGPQSRSCYMLIKVLDIEVKLQPISVINGENFNDSYRKINPSGTVPTLIDGHFILRDGHTIMIYLCDKYAGICQPHLCPRDYMPRLKVLNLLFYEGCVLYRRYSHLVTEILLKKNFNVDMTYHQAKVIDSYNSLETNLKCEACMTGNCLTIADLSIITTLSSLDLMFPISQDQWPNLHRWFENLKNMDCYKCNDEGLQKLSHFLETEGQFSLSTLKATSALGSSVQPSVDIDKEKVNSFIVKEHEEFPMNKRSSLRDKETAKDNDGIPTNETLPKSHTPSNEDIIAALSEDETEIQFSNLFPKIRTSKIIIASSSHTDHEAEFSQELQKLYEKPAEKKLWDSEEEICVEDSQRERDILHKASDTLCCRRSSILKKSKMEWICRDCIQKNQRVQSIECNNSKMDNRMTEPNQCNCSVGPQLKDTFVMTYSPKHSLSQQNINKVKCVEFECRVKTKDETQYYQGKGGLCPCCSCYGQQEICASDYACAFDEGELREFRSFICIENIDNCDPSCPCALRVSERQREWNIHEIEDTCTEECECSDNETDDVPNQECDIDCKCQEDINEENSQGYEDNDCDDDPEVTGYNFVCCCANEDDDNDKRFQEVFCCCDEDKKEEFCCDNEQESYNDMPSDLVECCYEGDISKPSESDNISHIPICLCDGYPAKPMSTCCNDNGQPIVDSSNDTISCFCQDTDTRNKGSCCSETENLDTESSDCREAITDDEFTVDFAGCPCNIFELERSNTSDGILNSVSDEDYQRGNKCENVLKCCCECSCIDENRKGHSGDQKNTTDGFRDEAIQNRVEKCYCRPDINYQMRLKSTNKISCSEDYYKRNKVFDRHCTCSQSTGGFKPVPNRESVVKKKANQCDDRQCTPKKCSCAAGIVDRKDCNISQATVEERNGSYKHVTLELKRRLLGSFKATQKRLPSKNAHKPDDDKVNTNAKTLPGPSEEESMGYGGNKRMLDLSTKANTSPVSGTQNNIRISLIHSSKPQPSVDKNIAPISENKSSTPPESSPGPQKKYIRKDKVTKPNQTLSRVADDLKDSKKYGPKAQTENADKTKKLDTESSVDAKIKGDGKEYLPIAKSSDNKKPKGADKTNRTEDNVKPTSTKADETGKPSKGGKSGASESEKRGSKDKDNVKDRDKIIEISRRTGALCKPLNLVHIKCTKCPNKPSISLADCDKLPRNSFQNAQEQDNCLKCQAECYCILPGESDPTMFCPVLECKMEQSCEPCPHQSREFQCVEQRPYGKSTELEVQQFDCEICAICERNSDQHDKFKCGEQHPCENSIAQQTNCQAQSASCSKVKPMCFTSVQVGNCVSDPPCVGLQANQHSLCKKSVVKIINCCPSGNTHNIKNRTTSPKKSARKSKRLAAGSSHCKSQSLESCCCREESKHVIKQKMPTLQEKKELQSQQQSLFAQDTQDSTSNISQEEITSIRHFYNWDDLNGEQLKASESKRRGIKNSKIPRLVLPKVYLVHRESHDLNHSQKYKEFCKLPTMKLYGGQDNHKGNQKKRLRYTYQEPKYSQEIIKRGSSTSPSRIPQLVRDGLAVRRKSETSRNATGLNTSYIPRLRNKRLAYNSDAKTKTDSSSFTTCEKYLQPKYQLAESIPNKSLSDVSLKKLQPKRSRSQSKNRETVCITKVECCNSNGCLVKKLSGVISTYIRRESPSYARHLDKSRSSLSNVLKAVNISREEETEPTSVERENKKLNGKIRESKCREYQIGNLRERDDGGYERQVHGNESAEKTGNVFVFSKKQGQYQNKPSSQRDIGMKNIERRTYTSESQSTQDLTNIRKERQYRKQSHQVNNNPSNIRSTLGQAKHSSKSQDNVNDPPNCRFGKPKEFYCYPSSHRDGCTNTPKQGFILGDNNRIRGGLTDQFGKETKSDTFLRVYGCSCMKSVAKRCVRKQTNRDLDNENEYCSLDLPVVKDNSSAEIEPRPSDYSESRLSKLINGPRRTLRNPAASDVSQFKESVMPNKQRGSAMESQGEEMKTMSVSHKLQDDNDALLTDMAKDSANLDVFQGTRKDNSQMDQHQEQSENGENNISPNQTTVQVFRCMCGRTIPCPYRQRLGPMECVEIAVEKCCRTQKYKEKDDQFKVKETIESMEKSAGESQTSLESTTDPIQKEDSIRTDSNGIGQTNSSVTKRGNSKTINKISKTPTKPKGKEIKENLKAISKGKDNQSKARETIESLEKSAEEALEPSLEPTTDPIQKEDTKKTDSNGIGKPNSSVKEKVNSKTMDKITKIPTKPNGKEIKEDLNDVSWKSRKPSESNGKVKKEVLPATNNKKSIEMNGKLNILQSSIARNSNASKAKAKTDITPKNNKMKAGRVSKYESTKYKSNLIESESKNQEFSKIYKQSFTKESTPIKTTGMSESSSQEHTEEGEHSKSPSMEEDNAQELPENLCGMSDEAFMKDFDPADTNIPGSCDVMVVTKRTHFLKRNGAEKIEEKRLVITKSSVSDLGNYSHVGIPDPDTEIIKKCKRIGDKVCTITITKENKVKKRSGDKD